MDNGRSKANVRRDYCDTKSSEEFASSDRFTENIYTADRAENVVRTGWEVEREILLYGEIQTAETEITTSRMLTDVDIISNGATAIVGTAVGVGSAMGLLDTDIPITSRQGKIDKKSLQKLIEKKQAKGHKHTGEDLENNFEMTVY